MSKFKVGDRVAKGYGFACRVGTVSEIFYNNTRIRVKWNNVEPDSIENEDDLRLSLTTSPTVDSALPPTEHPTLIEQDLSQLEVRVAARVLADDDKREQYPLYDGLFAYFPAALCEVARWSQVGGAKHTPGEKLHWKREVSTDHENKILRHLLDADKEIDDGFIEAVALAWRSLALCQSLLERRGWAEGANGKWKRE